VFQKGSALVDLASLQIIMPRKKMTRTGNTTNPPQWRSAECTGRAARVCGVGVVDPHPLDAWTRSLCAVVHSSWVGFPSCAHACVLQCNADNRCADDCPGLTAAHPQPERHRSSSSSTRTHTRRAGTRRTCSRAHTWERCWQRRSSCSMSTTPPGPWRPRRTITCQASQQPVRRTSTVRVRVRVLDRSSTSEYEYEYESTAAVLDV
jgi:hypothetical protein